MPTQPRLPFSTPATASRKESPIEKQNQEAAEIILAEPAKYGGEGSALVDWAKQQLEKRL